MSERGLQFEKDLVGWLAHSPNGCAEFRSFYVPGVLDNTGADKYIEMLLQHGPGSAASRLKDKVHTGAVDPQDVETALRWAQGAPSTDDAYMLETARVYLRHRCHAMHAEQVALAAEVWDEALVAAADSELKQRMSKLVEHKERNGFTAAGVSKAFSVEAQKDLLTIPGYAGHLFRGRARRGDFIVIQAQPKTGKSALTARLDVAGMRAGNRVLHVSIGDQEEHEATARIISSECQRNGKSYGPDGFRGVSCCAKSLAGCDKKCYAEHGYAPLNPPVPAEYLETNEVPKILKAFPSFRPCTLCKGTPDYVPHFWWELADDKPMTEDEALSLFDSIKTCGEYGEMETLFYPARSIDVKGLAGLLEERRAAGEPVDIFSIDYGDMVGLQSGMPKWEALQYMWEGTRALAPEYDCLVISATQGNRVGGDMVTQSSSTVAGSRASIDNATLVVSVNQTEAERAHHILRLSVVAAREGAFSPVHQAMCISRMDIQDPMYDSWHKFVKTDERRN